MIARRSVKPPWAVVVICVSLGSCTTLSHHPSQDEAAILELRSLINTAFAAQDTAPLRFIYDADYSRSTASVILKLSADSNIRLWGDNFRRDPSLRVKWTPQQMGFYAAYASIGVETGTEKGTRCHDGRLEHWSGRYLAQWRKVGAHWRLLHEAEGTDRIKVDTLGGCEVRH
jgi:hypothetical protein